MRGSDTGTVAQPPKAPAGPWGSPRDGPRARERVFRGSLFSQLTQGAWPFAFAVILPGIVTIGALLWKYVFGRGESDRWVEVLITLLFVAMGPLIGAMSKGLMRGAGKTATCGWVALGDRYIRLGMSFLRSRILFGQIIDVERGTLRSGQWIAEGEGDRPEPDAPEPAPATLDDSGTPPPARPPKPSRVTSPRRLVSDRVRIRLVMRGMWEVVSVAYRQTIDPSGELTTTLRLAASQTRHKLGLREGLPDEEITLRFRELAARYQQEIGAHRPGQVEEAILSPEFPKLGWRPPKVDPLPEAEPLPELQRTPPVPGTAPQRPPVSEAAPPPVEDDRFAFEPDAHDSAAPDVVSR